MFASGVADPNWQAIGEAIQRRRAVLGLHVEQICRIADVSQSTWEQLEAGKRPLPGGGSAPPNPRPATIGRIARGLSVPVAALQDLIAGDLTALDGFPLLPHAPKGITAEPRLTASGYKSSEAKALSGFGVEELPEEDQEAVRVMVRQLRRARGLPEDPP